MRVPNLAFGGGGGGGGGGLHLAGSNLATLQVRCLSEIHVYSRYIPVDGNFEDVTTAILREIGQDSDSPDSDSGSEMELESQHVRARGQFSFFLS